MSGLCFRKMAAGKVRCSGGQEWRQGHRLEDVRGPGRRRQWVVATTEAEALGLEDIEEGNATEPGDRLA